MKTNLTKKQVGSLCSKDGLKPALNGLYYEPNKKRLTATNGHALISYKVESCENESTAVIPTEVFKTKAKDNCKYYINCEASRISDEGKANYNLIDEQYPDVDSVQPSYDNSIEYGVNLELLKKLCDAVPKDSNNHKFIKLTINLDRNDTAIKFKQYSNADEDSLYSGLIMPIRIESK